MADPFCGAAGRGTLLPVPGSAVRAYHFNLADVPCGSLRAAEAPRLSPEFLCERDRVRYAALRSDPARRRFLLQRELLYGLLAESAPGNPAAPDIRVDADGRPFLADRSVSFSLSHSLDDFCVAVTPGPGRVGVDVERLSKIRDPAGYAEFLFGESRFADARAVLRAWTALEAYAKCSGVPLASLPRSDFALFAADLSVDSGCAAWDGFRFSLFDVSAGSSVAVCEEAR